MIQADYLVVGAGAMGMAFADAVLTETDATLAIVDRCGKPGGHWTRTYPHVRLHQPSAFYGVNSRPLGSGTKDTVGWNAGLFELACGSEVTAYFDQVMNQQFLPSGRVQYFPMCEYAEGGAIVSLASGKAEKVTARKVVDAKYSHVTVPSMRPPEYEVAEGARCVPPNALTTLEDTPSAYVVIGAGKTGMDACLWLLEAGVATDAITWIVPRDSWLIDRASIQPGAEFFESTVGGFALQMEAAALASSVDDLFERLESTGQLIRIDPSVRPTMYRCATVSLAELDGLRMLKNIVRMGHVQAIDSNEIILDSGAIPTSPNTLHIDCTADGLGRRPAAPVFDGDRVSVQSVRTCQPAFSAAFIGHVESCYQDEAEKE
ncbi:MAG: NAD(P)/FAD-dependent oxidoreductase [Dehalococcoidia bacterium]